MGRSIVAAASGHYPAICAHGPWAWRWLRLAAKPAGRATHVGLTDPASLCPNVSSNGSIRRKGRHPADAAVMHARANALSEAIGSIDASCHAAAGKPTVGIGLSSAEPKKAPNLAENLETGTTAWLRSPFTCERGRGDRAEIEIGEVSDAIARRRRRRRRRRRAPDRARAISAGARRARRGSTGAGSR